MKGLRPYSGPASAVKGDEASAYWALMWYGAATGSAIGSTLGAGALTATGEWYLYQNVLRFHPAFAAVTMVLYSPDISYWIGEEIELQTPGAGGQMTNSLHYAQGGMMSGGTMPVVPSGFITPSPPVDYSYQWLMLQLTGSSRVRRSMPPQARNA